MHTCMPVKTCHLVKMLLSIMFDTCFISLFPTRNIEVSLNKRTSCIRQMPTRGLLFIPDKQIIFVVL